MTATHGNSRPRTPLTPDALLDVIRRIGFMYELPEYSEALDRLHMRGKLRYASVMVGGRKVKRYEIRGE